MRNTSTASFKGSVALIRAKINPKCSRILRMVRPVLRYFAYFWFLIKRSKSAARVCSTNATESNATIRASL